MKKSVDPVNIDFLFTELQTGLTFANMALSALPNDRRKQETEKALEAHDSFLKYRERVALSEEQIHKMDADFEKLKTALRRLGESV